MNFCFIGCGYIAEKHFEAIKEIGGNILAICDPYLSQGKTDKYFTGIKFFNEIEVFERWLLYNNKLIDYLVVCSPNYLHFTHIVMGLDYKIKVICEKPLVIRYSDFDIIQKENTIYPIMQLRENENFKRLKKEIENGKQIENVEVIYSVFRGDWYNRSWKSDIDKSGGIIYNLGVHLFDILIWLLGEPIKCEVKEYEKNKISLKIQFKKSHAKIWLQSQSEKKENIRNFNFDSQKINPDIVGGHTAVYKKIIENKWITLADVRPTYWFLKQVSEAIK